MFEKEFIRKDIQHIAATDEVGRGPLAGPVASACVLTACNTKDLKKLCEYLRSYGVTDSKRLTDKKRVKILSDLEINFGRSLTWEGKINGVSLSMAIDKKSPKIIDKINILQASLTSMRDAYKKVQIKSGSALVLIDGNKLFKPVLNTELVAVVKGDSKSALIGLASIVAKVYRDKLMNNYAKKYPHYSFEKNAGYPTKTHREAIVKYGITPIHRKTFGGVKEFINGDLQ